MSWSGSRGRRDGLFPQLCRRRRSCCPACSGPVLWGAVLSPLLLSGGGRWPQRWLGPRETRACMSSVGLWGVMVVATGLPILPAAGGFSVPWEGTHPCSVPRTPCRGRGGLQSRWQCHRKHHRQAYQSASCPNARRPKLTRHLPCYRGSLDPATYRRSHALRPLSHSSKPDATQMPRNFAERAMSPVCSEVR